MAELYSKRVVDDDGATTGKDKGKSADCFSNVYVFF